MNIHEVNSKFCLQILAVILSNMGIALFAYMDGQTYRSRTIVGVILGATAACVAAVFKVCTETFVILIHVSLRDSIRAFPIYIEILNHVLSEEIKLQENQKHAQLLLVRELPCRPRMRNYS